MIYLKSFQKNMKEMNMETAISANVHFLLCTIFLKKKVIFLYIIHVILPVNFYIIYFLSEYEKLNRFKIFIFNYVLV